MKPIDKIEWRENRAKEEQLLEYVSLLEQIYIPDLIMTMTTPENMALPL